MSRYKKKKILKVPFPILFFFYGINVTRTCFSEIHPF